MYISRSLVLLYFFINYSAIGVYAGNRGLMEKAGSFLPLPARPLDSMAGILKGCETDRGSIIARTGDRPAGNFNDRDSLPKINKVRVIIPFEYKQSSLNYSYTFRLIDSVIEILLSNELVTLSIDGYSYFDEGSDNICFWLSYNRALAVKSYVQGRGIDSSRVIAVEGRSKFRSIQRKAKKEAVNFNCTAEIILNYPIPPPAVKIQDRDEDGIADDEDGCPNEYGDKAHNGCPDKDAIIVPFEPEQSALCSATYKVLDSVITILLDDPLLTISIEGHAYNKEGVETVCDRLSRERADIVKRYLLTRRIDAARIDSIKSFSNLRPINAGRNSWEIARNSRAEIFLVHH